MIFNPYFLTKMMWGGYLHYKEDNYDENKVMIDKVMQQGPICLVWYTVDSALPSGQRKKTKNQCEVSQCL